MPSPLPGMASYSGTPHIWRDFRGDMAAEMRAECNHCAAAALWVALHTACHLRRRSLAVRSRRGAGAQAGGGFVTRDTQRHPSGAPESGTPRTLESVGSRAWFGWGCVPSRAFKTPAHTTHWCPPNAAQERDHSSSSWGANAITRAQGPPVTYRCVPP